MPLDLFGGQGRPITQAMLDYIRTRQIDSSKQTLDLFSANITGDLFDIGDRSAGFAVGVEHRRYDGDVQSRSAAPDGRIAGLVRLAGVAELPRERGLRRIQLPGAGDPGHQRRGALFRLLDLRQRRPPARSGFRWQPIEDFVVPRHLLDGLPRAEPGRVVRPDPVRRDPGRSVRTDRSIRVRHRRNSRPSCAAQGVPPGFEQANTQITTFTGGNPNLQPEKSDSYTLGIVYTARAGRKALLVADQLTSR